MDITFDDLVTYAKPYAGMIEGFDQLAAGEWPSKVNKDGVVVYPDFFVYITLSPVLFLGVIDHGLSPLQQHWIEQYRLNMLSVHVHDAVPVFVGDTAPRKSEAFKDSSEEEEHSSTSSDDDDSEADWG